MTRAHHKSAVGVTCATRNYDKGDGRCVRPTTDGQEALLAEYDDDWDRQIAFELMARCGCRSQEAVYARIWLDCARADPLRGEVLERCPTCGGPIQ